MSNDLEKSKQFYKEILGLRVIVDFGANITLTGGLSLQTKDTWTEFINQTGTHEITFNGNNAEMYFEEDDFDSFIQKLNNIDTIEYVHNVVEHSWGQRGVRFYDPDGHIIEVGENLKAVCKRFIDSGMSVEEVAKRMDVQVKFVNQCIK